MLEEYDLRGKKGIRGKYFQNIRDGYTTIIHKSDGTTKTIETIPIFLEPDLQSKFPSSEAVNRALREFITLKK